MLEPTFPVGIFTSPFHFTVMFISERNERPQFDIFGSNIENEYKK